MKPIKPAPDAHPSETFPNEWPQAFALHMRCLAERYRGTLDEDPHKDVRYALRSAAELFENIHGAMAIAAWAECPDVEAAVKRARYTADHLEDMARLVMVNCRNALPYGIDMARRNGVRVGNRPRESKAWPRRRARR